MDQKQRLPHHATKPCRFFHTSAGCRYGKKCTFSHDTPLNPTIPARSNHHAGDNEQNARGGNMDSTRQRFIKWRYLIPLNINSARPLGSQLQQFLQEANALVNADTAVGQEIVLLMISPGGIVRLKELFDRDFDSYTLCQVKNVMQSYVFVFFQLITHTNIVTSIMLEDALGTVYNFLYGRQGERASNVFKSIVSLAVSDDAAVVGANLQSILMVLSDMIQWNGHAVLNEDLQSIAEVLFTTVARMDDYSNFQVDRLVEKISRRLSISQLLPERERRKTIQPRKATFLLPKDMPGHLSAAGPRHDNDHADISKIQILPTYDEIQCQRPEYLPVRDPLQSHLAGIDGLFDRHFRLLREDTVGQLRDAIRMEMNQATVQPGRNQIRTFTYTDLRIINLSLLPRRGFAFTVSVSQPVQLRQKSAPARKEWWEFSKRLQADALVCLINEDNTVMFCIVETQETEVMPTLEEREDANQLGVSMTKQKLNLWADSSACHFRLQLLDLSEQTIGQIIDMYGASSIPAKVRLVEFPGVLLPAFQPTLQALQKMSQAKELPFAKLIAPEESERGIRSIDPPYYATRPGFSYDLDSILDNVRSMTYSVNQKFDIDAFKQQCQLDAAQAESLLACLGRSFALVQGPPGTGKSYTGVALIKVLLAARKKASLGPIVCVCYTNHALDQLLEHLFHHEVKQIIRIGSKSKSEVLADCNLRVVAKNMESTPAEKRERWEIMKSVHDEELEMAQLVQSLSNMDHKSTIESYLEAHHQPHHVQLFSNERDDEGFQTVKYDKGKEIANWLQGDYPGGIFRSERPVHKLLVADLFQMTNAERRDLYQYWIQDLRHLLKERLIRATQSHKQKKTKLDRIRDGQNIRCLQEANIVGVTTSGLAKQLDLLRKLQSKVLVCEEAGEVLEAHMLTALLPSLQHVILIGDHLQLPPHIQNFELSRENHHGEQYSLDVSLFERLVTSGEGGVPALPFSVLETQRRMHPSISHLINATLYSKLQDSPAVFDYPQVAGMRKRLFWFDHSEHETGSSEQAVSTSHTNQFETSMVVALVTHLVRQGVYEPNDIAVLTPYLGQLMKIRRILRQSFEIHLTEGDEDEITKQGLDSEEQDLIVHRKQPSRTNLLKTLKVSTIDNFQGEEAKVVIISLVRSNDRKKCGFLRTPNRINVLLSRAKHGMYIIGDSSTSGHVDMWGQVITILQDSDNMGTSLELQCPRHPDAVISVSNPDDFLMFSPEGGCHLRCDRRLLCGHACINKCHATALHNAVQCLEDCPRSRIGCDHACPNRCGERCPSVCQVQLTGLDVTLSCGHKRNTLPCWQNQNPTLVECKDLVMKKVPNCQHQVKTRCNVDVENPEYRCEAACDAGLPCGHSCRKKCRECRVDGVINHGICQAVCDRNYDTCKHRCTQICHSDEEQCPPCNAPCEISCGHSKCYKKCHEPCAPCAEGSCSSLCPHDRCTMPCAAPCDWLPCSKRCQKLLACGHQCPTVCGEVCPPPKYCQICCDENVQDLMVDFILMSTYSDIDLNEEPCIIPACGHILTISSMDGQMDMKRHYRMEENVVVAAAAESAPFSMSELKVCSTCRGPLRNIARYGRIVRRALIDESTKKFIKWSARKTMELTQLAHDRRSSLAKSTERSEQALDVKISMKGTRKDQMKLIIKHRGKRYRKIIKVRELIASHLTEVQIEEQPYQKVWDLVNNARRKHLTSNEMEFDKTAVQTREALRVAALLLRLDLAIVSDFFASTDNADVEVDLEQNRQDCLRLIEESTAAKQPTHVMEGHLFFAQYCAAERSRGSAQDLLSVAEEHIKYARELVSRYEGSTKHLVGELEETERMLYKSAFYTAVKDEEFITVMRVMAEEFGESGHWYTCENGHPFTVGECGRPMEQTVCPQCQAPVGGMHHQAAEGVRRATELEERFGQLRV